MRPHSRIKFSNDEDDFNENNKRYRQEPSSSGPHFDENRYYENSTNLNFNTYINRSNYHRPTYHQYGHTSQHRYSDRDNDLPSYNGYNSYHRSYGYSYDHNGTRRYDNNRGYNNRGYSTSNRS